MSSSLILWVWSYVNPLTTVRFSQAINSLFSTGLSNESSLLSVSWRVGFYSFWRVLLWSSAESSRDRVSYSNRHTVVLISDDERGEIRTPSSIRSLSRGQTLELSVSVDLTKIKKRVLIQVTGMSCASCVAKIERHLMKKKGEEFIICCVNLIPSTMVWTIVVAHQ